MYMIINSFAILSTELLVLVLRMLSCKCVSCVSDKRHFMKSIIGLITIIRKNFLQAEAFWKQKFSFDHVNVYIFTKFVLTRGF